MSFELDSRLLESCFELGDWSLSRVVLKNNADYPWLILIPRIAKITDIDELTQTARHTLMDEISELSRIVRTYFKADKINLGALGNIVPQLHVHVLGRFTHDRLWPQGVWQKELEARPYTEEELQPLLEDLRGMVRRYSPLL